MNTIINYYLEKNELNTLATEHRFSMRSLNASLGTSEGSGYRISLHRYS